MNVSETIRTFLGFFDDGGHRAVPGSSLVPPDGDPVLFATAGRHARWAMTGTDLRYLHQTHGLPRELVTELLD